MNNLYTYLVVKCRSEKHYERLTNIMEQYGEVVVPRSEIAVQELTKKSKDDPKILLVKQPPYNPRKRKFIDIEPPPTLLREDGPLEADMTAPTRLPGQHNVSAEIDNRPPTSTQPLPITTDDYMKQDIDNPPANETFSHRVHDITAESTGSRVKEEPVDECQPSTSAVSPKETNAVDLLGKPYNEQMKEEADESKSASAHTLDSEGPPTLKRPVSNTHPDKLQVNQYVTKNSAGFHMQRCEICDVRVKYRPLSEWAIKTTHVFTHVTDAWFMCSSCDFPSNSLMSVCRHMLAKHTERYRPFYVPGCSTHHDAERLTTLVERTFPGTQNKSLSLRSQKAAYHFKEVMYIVTFGIRPKTKGEQQAPNVKNLLADTVMKCKLCEFTCKAGEGDRLKTEKHSLEHSHVNWMRCSVCGLAHHNLYNLQMHIDNKHQGVGEVLRRGLEELSRTDYQKIAALAQENFHPLQQAKQDVPDSSTLVARRPRTTRLYFPDQNS